VRSESPLINGAIQTSYSPFCCQQMVWVSIPSELRGYSDPAKYGEHAVDGISLSQSPLSYGAIQTASVAAWKRLHNKIRLNPL